MTESRRRRPYWLGVSDVARQLDVSRSTIDRLINAGELPAVRIGVGRGTRRIAQRDVDGLVTRRREQATATACARRRLSNES